MQKKFVNTKLNETGRATSSYSISLPIVLPCGEVFKDFCGVLNEESIRPQGKLGADRAKGELKTKRRSTF